MKTKLFLIAATALLLGGGAAAATTAMAAATGPITGLAGKCIDVAGAGTANGTAIQLYDCNGATAQTWTVDQDIRALGKCLDVTAASTADGARIQLYDCNGTAAQRWTASNGQLVNTGSGR